MKHRSVLPITAPTVVIASTPSHAFLHEDRSPRELLPPEPPEGSLEQVFGVYDPTVEDGDHPELVPHPTQIDPITSNPQRLEITEDLSNVSPPGLMIFHNSRQDAPLKATGQLPQLPLEKGMISNQASPVRARFLPRSAPSP